MFVNRVKNKKKITYQWLETHRISSHCCYWVNMVVVVVAAEMVMVAIVVVAWYLYT